MVGELINVHIAVAGLELSTGDSYRRVTWIDI